MQTIDVQHDHNFSIHDFFIKCYSVPPECERNVIKRILTSDMLKKVLLRSKKIFYRSLAVMSNLLHFVSVCRHTLVQCLRAFILYFAFVLIHNWTAPS